MLFMMFVITLLQIYSFRRQSKYKPRLQDNQSQIAARQMTFAANCNPSVINIPPPSSLGQTPYSGIN